MWPTSIESPQLTFTCSQPTVETLEKSVKHVSLLQTLKISTPFVNVSIVEFEQVNISWVNDSNAELFMLNFYVTFLGNSLVYVTLIKDSFLLFPPKEF